MLDTNSWDNGVFMSSSSTDALPPPEPWSSRITAFNVRLSVKACCRSSVNRPFSCSNSLARFFSFVARSWSSRRACSFLARKDRCLKFFQHGSVWRNVFACTYAARFCAFLLSVCSELSLASAGGVKSLQCPIETASRACVHAAWSSCSHSC